MDNVVVSLLARKKYTGQGVAISHQTLYVFDITPTDSCKWPTEEIMGARNSNFISQVFSKIAF